MERGTVGFSGLLQASARDVIQPAVERAAQAAILATCEGQIGAAVGAVAVQQAVTAGGITKQHEVFAQQTHTLDRAPGVKFLGQRNRLPITPHQSAARCAEAGFRDPSVGLSGQHVGASGGQIVERTAS